MSDVLSPCVSCQPETSGKLKDAIVARKVVRAIADTGYAWLDVIDVHVRDGLVTLNGNVHSTFLRETARKAAESVPDVTIVNCHVRVT